MKIGNEEITRDMMPAQIAWQNANPDHLRQTFQDVLNAKLGSGMQLPQAQDQGMMQTAQTGSNQWQQ